MLSPSESIPSGYCLCGCGAKPLTAARYLRGHHNKGKGLTHGSKAWMKENDPCGFKALKAKDDAKYYAKHREKLAAYYAEWRLRNRDKIKNYKATYSLRNRERIRTHNAERYLANRERIREYWSNHPEIHRKYRAAHPEEIKERTKIYRSKQVVPCPLCASNMQYLAWRKSVICMECRALMQTFRRTQLPVKRHNLGVYVETIRKGEIEQWQTAITLRRAIRPLQKLLKPQGETRSSPTSEKSRRSTNS